ncbi:MAG: ATP-binding protein [Phycisphaerae bacterium]
MSDASNRPIRILLWSVPAQLAVVRAAVEKACESIGFDGREVGRIVLSVDEALANIIRHAYDCADDQPIEAVLTVLGDGGPEGVEIRLRDYGRAADTSKIKSRELDDIRPGGLGVHIMNECMDSVTYEHPEGGGTLLTMTKMLPDAKEEKAK